ncbi:bifunctional pyr operon transcriptional regulator/uracil phosphoribosyltransferase PyrR [Ichthyobacterium seriolicida]|uniref:Uracil phosphoribosyltransferase n=1 Tax=Ichthyobacterium seriolicida TaxID=242600 RepID=A0A1J1E9H0_9FLAO|nr:bifunctional pyr operon transcriptional regulator/uracil phosphoribosyltransferase PyrR [Ichthyobacterium seriolicida]BAV94176.1 uracil phosphoribosyltransferase [Ichthyobacterium seriolicida]
MKEKTLLNHRELYVTLERLAYQLIENHGDFSHSAIIGIQPRGVSVAKKIYSLVSSILNVEDIKLGFLDITFFRDDFRIKKDSLKVSKTSIDFLVDGKKIILIDDVLYSGRSVCSAFAAINSFGRPLKIELLTLIDRRFSRDTPIQADYKGKEVDSFNTERVVVKWEETHGEEGVFLVDN